MSLTKKFAAFGAAAALSATGLVAATGTSANAATPTYQCKIKLAANNSQSGAFTVPLNFSVPSPYEGDVIKKGTVVSGAADMADLFTKAAAGDEVLKGFVDTLNGEGSGAVVYGPSLQANGLTVTPGDFEVWAAGVQKLPFALQAVTIPGSQLGALKTSKALPVKASFTADQAVTFPAGTYPLNLPDAFSLTLSTGDLPIGSVDCSGTDQKAQLVVKKKAESTALKAAKAQLAKDEAALAKAKKALKKAKGHKKVVLKKKVAKLVKKVKADQAKIKSLS